LRRLDPSPGCASALLDVGYSMIGLLVSGYQN
jgi:hypothetical protein